MVGSTSHLVIKYLSLLVANRLSGLECLFVTICCNVGIPFGRIMFKLYDAMSLMRELASSSTWFVKR